MHKRSGGRAVRQRSAKPCTAVRIRSRPHLKKIIFILENSFIFANFFTKKSLICESSSVGRAQPCQGWGREFESRLSLH